MSETAIQDFESQLRLAQLSSDVAALDRLLDDALMFTTLDGRVVGKNEDLALHRTGRLRITKMEPSDMRVQKFGSVAIVSVQMAAEAVLDGICSNGDLRYTRVWVQSSDGWRVTAGHMSVVATKH